MDKQASIEDRLSQLMPPAVSEAGMAGLLETIDQLSEGGAADEMPEASIAHGATSATANRSIGPSTANRSIGRVAAVIALLVVPVVIFKSNPDWFGSGSSQVAVYEDDISKPLTEADWVVLKTTNLIHASENDGLIIPDDGSAPHYRYRYHVVDEEQVRDTETGTVITLRQPRQEVVTIPVTQF